MSIRYFKATDGVSTAFRASKTKVYRSASFDNGIQFASAPGRTGLWFEAEEITKAEYDALQALKVERVKASGSHPALANSPWQSWISNATLMGG